MKRLAVINCKSSKPEGLGPFTGEELYWPSHIFRAQVEFIKEFYDGYVILSAAHGIIHPNERKYEAYNATLFAAANSGMHWGWTKPVIDYGRQLTKEETLAWAKQCLEDPVWADYDTIDFHISLPYLKWFSTSKEPLKAFRNAYPDKIINYVKQPEGLANPPILYPKLAAEWREGSRSFDTLNYIKPRREVTDDQVVRWKIANPKGRVEEFRKQVGSCGDKRFERLV